MPRYHIDKNGNIWPWEEWQRKQEADNAILELIFLLAFTLVKALLHFCLGMVLSSIVFFGEDLERLFSCRWLVWTWIGLSVIHISCVKRYTAWIIDALFLLAIVAFYFCLKNQFSFDGILDFFVEKGEILISQTVIFFSSSTVS